MPGYVFKKMLGHFQAEVDTNVEIGWGDNSPNGALTNWFLLDPKWISKAVMHPVNSLIQ